MKWLSIFLSSLAFALYVLCPRMSAMLAEKAQGLERPHSYSAWTTILYTALLPPLKYPREIGLLWAVLLAAIADFAAAALLGVVELRVGVELAMITIFVYAEIRILKASIRLTLNSITLLLHRKCTP